RLSCRIAEVEEPQHALAARDAEYLAAAPRAEDSGRSPVRGETPLGGAEQDEHRGGGGGTDVLLVLHEVAREQGGEDDERRRAVEFRRLGRARRFLQTVERRGAEHAEAPRLRQVMVRGKTCEREQLQQRPARDRLGAERLVRPSRCRQLGEAHARPAPTCSSTPARRRSLEKGHPASACSSASCRLASSSPSAATTASTCDATIS